MAAIAALPAGQLWRHGQAGDFPHTAGRISRRYLRAIIAANRGRNGYTYTHHSLAIGENASLIRSANRNGFTVNVSTESESAADRAIAAGLPAVLAVPSDEERVTWQTAAGNRVLVCPAQRSDTKTCADCKLCHKRGRRVIIAFLAHGINKRKVNAVIAAKGAE
jgi:transcription initiation factor TFIID subunit TAF12